MAESQVWLRELKVLNLRFGDGRSVLEEVSVASLSNIFGSDDGSAVPGGNVAKPLIIALLALFASRYLAGKGKDSRRAPVPGQRCGFRRQNPHHPSPGNVLDGLGGLVTRF